MTPHLKVVLQISGQDQGHYVAPHVSMLGRCQRTKYVSLALSHCVERDEGVHVLLSKSRGSNVNLSAICVLPDPWGQPKCQCATSTTL